MGGYKVLIGVIAFIVIIFLLGIREKNKRQQEIVNLIKEQYGKTRKLENPLRLGVIDGYYLNRLSSENEDFFIDDITWNDLEMDKIYGKLNHTSSFMGEEYLYYRLRKPYFEEDVLQRQEEDVLYMKDHPVLREQMQIVLADADKSSKYSIYDCLNVAGTDGFNKNIGIHILNYSLLLISIILLFVKTGLGLICLFCALAFAILSYFKIKAQIGKYDVVLKEILRLSYAGKNINEFCKKEQIFKSQRDEIEQALNSLHSLTGKASKVLGKNGRGLGAGAVGMDYINMIFHFDQIVLEGAIPQISSQKDAIDSLMDNLGYIDFVIAISSYRESLDYYCVPVFTLGGSDGESAKALYHPLIDYPVCNDYVFKRPVLLTGSNASGKSTFLRTVALNMLMAYSIHTAHAAEFCTGFHKLYTSMALRDDLEGGDSYFMAEIKSLKRILDAIQSSDETGRDVVFFIDEVLRGTNTIERISASNQILKFMAERVKISFAATHDIELTDLLSSQYDNYHFSETLDENAIHFDYLLKEGKADSKNAISLLFHMGYARDIVDYAKQQADDFLKNGKWS